MELVGRERSRFGRGGERVCFGLAALELALGHPGKAVRQVGSLGEEPRLGRRLFCIVHTPVTSGEVGDGGWGYGGCVGDQGGCGFC